MKRGFLAIFGALAACAGSTAPDDPGSVVVYIISESPVDDPHSIVNGVAGGCLEGPLRYLSEVQGTQWAVESHLEVGVDFPDQRGCQNLSFSTRQCPTLHPQFTETQPDVWRIAGPVPPVNLRAMGEGNGGFTVTVSGRQFPPFGPLNVAPYDRIMFQEATGYHWDEVMPAPITELHLHPNDGALVAVTLRNAAGTHVCGTLRMDVSVSSGISVQQILSTTGAKYVNAPILVTSGSSPGHETLRVTVGAVSATLSVVVE